MQPCVALPFVSLAPSSYCTLLLISYSSLAKTDDGFDLQFQVSENNNKVIDVVADPKDHSRGYRTILIDPIILLYTHCFIIILLYKH